MDCLIEKESGIPYYRQLMEFIRQQIVTGDLKEGEKLPSELEMSSFYLVNRHTVRQAISELCRLGALYKVKGRGTFVAKPSLDMVEYRLSQQNRFSDNIRQVGKVPKSKLLQFEELFPPANVAQALKVGQAEIVYMLNILRSIDSRPFLLSKVYLPAKQLPDLIDHLPRFHSLFAIFKQYDIVPQRVKSIISVAFPSPEEAAILEMSINMPLLKVESVLKTQDDILIEYNISCYRGDLAKLSVDW